MSAFPTFQRNIEKSMYIVRPAYLVLSKSHPLPDSSTSFLSLANDWIENIEGGEQGNITGSKDELLTQTFPTFPEPWFSTVIPL